MTFADWLELATPHLPEVLAGHRERSRLRSVARHVPGDVLGAIEFRLTAGDPAVDFALRLTTPSQALGLAGLELGPSTAHFLRTWAEDASVREAIPRVWLEFDLGRDESGWPQPVICLEITLSVSTKALLEELLPLVRGRVLPRHQREMLARCREAIPEVARLLYTFDLRARGVEAVRFEILGLGVEESTRYLAGLAAPEVVESFESHASLLGDVERPHLSFDVEGEILPRIGFEGSYRRLPEREKRWSALLERLIDSGLCERRKAEALLAWPGVSGARQGSERWPEGVGGHCVRSLSHVKLVMAPGVATLAKGYLLLQHLAGSA